MTYIYVIGIMEVSVSSIPMTYIYICHGEKVTIRPESDYQLHSEGFLVCLGIKIKIVTDFDVGSRGTTTQFALVANVLICVSPGVEPVPPIFQRRSAYH